MDQSMINDRMRYTYYIDMIDEINKLYYHQSQKNKNIHTVLYACNHIIIHTNILWNDLYHISHQNNNNNDDDDDIDKDDDDDNDDCADDDNDGDRDDEDDYCGDDDNDDDGCDVGDSDYDDIDNNDDNDL